jgi:hypothetical protein
MPNPHQPTWQDLGSQAFGQVAQWRKQHPHATFSQIEQAADEHLARLRTQIIQDLAQDSPLSDLAQLAAAERPTCLHCGATLQPRGRGKRILTTNHQQDLTLERSYATCPQCGSSFFPPRP